MIDCESNVYLPPRDEDCSHCDDLQEQIDKKQNILIPGDNITIEDDVISASGNVEVEQILTSGIKIATITVDGEDTDLYSPSGGGGGGTLDHTELYNRDEDDQHPISAITDLQDNLDNKADVSDIPTKTSDLTNDSGFLTEHQDISGKVDKPSTEGTEGQVLATDGDGGTYWKTVSGGGGGTSDYLDLENKPQINGVELSGNKTTSQLGINIPTKTSDLTNDSGFLVSSDIAGKADTTYVDSEIERVEDEIPSLSGYATEAWVENKHYLVAHQDISGKADITYVDNEIERVEDEIPDLTNYATKTYVSNYHDITKIDLTEKGANDGVAELDENGKVPSSQLPSYVDDVLEYATKTSFPVTGETGKIYIALDTNLSYRWSGSAYVEISPSLALGETSSTAYRGDRGKTAYDHSQIVSGNPHGVTWANLTGTKPTNVSDFTNDAGYLTSDDITDKADITYVDSEIERVEGEIPSLSGYATETWVENKHYLTSHQDISGKVDKPSSEGTDGQVLATDGEGSTYWKTVSGGGGTSNYNELSNKPKINGVELSGDKTTSQLGINIPTKTSDLTNDSDFITSDDIADKADVSYVDGEIERVEDEIPSLTGYATETWVENKHYLTAHQDISGKADITYVDGEIARVENEIPDLTGYATETYVNNHHDATKLDASEKGENGGVAELDENGKVLSSQLPSYVDDVLEYATKSSFPATGETGKIYIATDTSLTYRWSGSTYVEISPSLALGETSSTAYRGDRGKIAYEHSQITSGNPHGVTYQNLGGTKPTNVSDFTNDAGYLTLETLPIYEGDVE